MIDTLFHKSLDTSKFTILNVDDNEAGRYAINRILKKAGFMVKEAATGQRALQMAEEQPDLIILDINLPDIDGFEVCRRIKADPAISLIPILHLSATYMDSESRVQGLEGGADAYLAHPVEPPVLIATIKALLRMHQAESRVLAAARQWQVTFDTINDGVCLLDRQGIIIQCNQGMGHLLNRQLHEIIGRRCCELIGCNHLGPEWSCFQRMQESGQRESFDHSVNDRWFHVSLDPILDEAGRMSGAVQVISDITGQKRAELERGRLHGLLEAERARFEAVLKQMPAGVIIVEAPSGKVILGNEQVEKIWRHPVTMSDAVKQYGEWKGFHPDGSPYRPTEWPLVRSVRHGEVIINEEIDILRGDGSHGTISVSSAPIRDGDGRIYAAVVTFSDMSERKEVEKELQTYRHHLEELVKERTSELTVSNDQLELEINERKQAEAKLRESELKYSTLVEQARDWVVIVQDGVFKFANKAVSTITGYAVEEVMGKPFVDFLSPESRDFVSQRYALRLTGENPPSFYEAKVLNKDGTTRDIEISAEVIQYQEKPATMAVVRDITARKKMEEELQKAQRLESLGILAGGIAHDFNNILTAIIGNLSLAEMLTKPGNRVFRLLTEMQKSSHRAKDLTQQLLTFSKGGAPVRKTASISELLKDTTTFALRGSKVKAEFSLAKDLWPGDIDIGQISQVINNLVINAKQAMTDGGIIKVTASNVTIGSRAKQDTYPLSVTTRTKDGVPMKENLPLKEGEYIKISIGDQGTGIPDEILNKIFDLYFTTKEQGSGLGLSTTYSIIKRHDGYIAVQSQVGVGTTFFIYLPASREKGVAVSPAPNAAAWHHRCKGKVLVMDDEEFIRDTAGQMLRFMGYEVELAKNGAEMIELYEKAKESGHPFDAVIMDLTVQGGMGGEEAISKLRKVDPEVKAIVSSGYSTDAIMADFERAGFDGVIVKPYEVEELGEALHKVIEGK